MMVRKSTPTRRRTTTPKSREAKVVAPPSKTKDREIGIREIDNGFIVRESWTTKGGEYKSRERFSPTDPKITIPTLRKGVKK